jgi:hypothetical protein
MHEKVTGTWSPTGKVPAGGDTVADGGWGSPPMVYRALATQATPPGSPGPATTTDFTPGADVSSRPPLLIGTYWPRGLHPSGSGSGTSPSTTTAEQN